MSDEEYTAPDPYRDEKLSSTIKNPKAYRGSRPARYDGHFAWKWTKGCFGNESMSPMDLDAMVERKGNFLIFETKDKGVEIPTGQWITFSRLYALRCCSICWLYGKGTPTHIKYWPALAWSREEHKYPPTDEDMEAVSRDQARAIVSGWYDTADARPYPESQEGTVDIEHLRAHSAEMGERLIQTEAALHRVYDALAGGDAWRPPGIAESREW